MTQELSLGQNHAWNLARTLMMPVILFKVDDNEYGVLPAEDLDDNEVEAIFEYCPYTGGKAGSLNRPWRRRAAVKRQAAREAAPRLVVEEPTISPLPAAPLRPLLAAAVAECSAKFAEELI